jgi:hypothetical protein
MRKTSDLIDSLVDSAAPVRRLAPPLRTCILLALAALILALLCVVHGVRRSFNAFEATGFVVSMLGALATAMLAVASFREPP